MTKNLLSTKFVIVLSLLSTIAISSKAQYLRTTYFMEGATNRTQLNPALQPTRGYFNVPVLSMNVAASSNSLGIKGISDILDSSDDFLNNTKTFNKLKLQNDIDVSLNEDIISFGFFNGKGNGFWSANIGIRADVSASIPKSLLELTRDTNNETVSWNNSNYDIRNQSVYLNAYTEVGIGYSHNINNRLTVGGKLKFLTGMGNLNLNIDQIYVYGHEAGIDSEYKIKANARLDGSIKGIDLLNSEAGYIDDIEFNKYGVAGYGAAIDLGATYKLLDNLTLSAAVIDLGFISWNKDSGVQASASRNSIYNKDNYDEFLKVITDGDILLDFDLLQLREEEGKSRTTSLASTLVFGAEYAIFENKLAFGLLSTTRFCEPKTLSELTLSANYRPKNWFNVALSYSALQSFGESFGLAVKLGPVIIGSDYIFFGNNQKCVNAYLGLSVPIGAKRDRN